MFKTFKWVDDGYSPKPLKVIQNENGGGRLYELPSGKLVPSVTTMLSGTQTAEKTRALTKWRKRVGEKEAARVSKSATNFGTAMHKQVENYLKNQPVSFENVIVEEAFCNFQFMLNRIDNVRHSEVQLYSEEFESAGQCDNIAEFDSVGAIIDFKTGNKPLQERYIGDYWLQLTAYSLMYEERTGNAFPLLIILAINRETVQPQMFCSHRKHHYVDLATRINTWREQNKGLTNEQFTF